MPDRKSTQGPKALFAPGTTRPENFGTVQLLLEKRSLDMRPEKAIVTSRLEFLSNALGIALVTASTRPIRAEARSRHGQSDRSASKSGRTTENISLTWD